MIRVLPVLLMALCLFLGSSPTLAHHSFAAEYDSDQPVTVDGVVDRVAWVNPHAYIYINVTEDDGEAQLWAFETLSPNALARQGWNRDSLAAGESVTIEGFMAKDGLPLSDGSGAVHANSRTITRSDGSRVYGGSAR
jgi:hypothetical protein